jgi:hypothetical protein
MTSHKKRFVVLGSAATVCCLLSAGLWGCGGSEPAPSARPAARRTAPSTPPPAPRATARTISQLMAELGIDERVRLPAELAPADEPARIAVLEFFDAFARGDDKALGSMLSGLDRAELEELVASGAWAETTAQISRIDVQTGQSPDGQDCALAVFYVSGDFQPQLWYYRVEADTAVFDAVAAPPNLIDRLGGSDWIAAWFEILEEELALADKPDEDYVVPQQDYTEPKEATSRGSSGPTGNPSRPTSPSRPSAPGGGGGGKRPKRGKRPPPGKGG